MERLNVSPRRASNAPRVGSGFVKLIPGAATPRMAYGIGSGLVGRWVLWRGVVLYTRSIVLYT